MKTPELSTPRLYLRPVHADDAAPIFSCWMNDPAVSRYMYWDASDDPHDAEEFVRFELDNVENDGWNRWIIQLHQTGAIIGTCLIFRNEAEQSWDVSYNLGRRYWGNGYAAEAMRCAMDFAVRKLGLRTCIADYAADNPASGRVLAKLGFAFEREIPFECGHGMRTIGRRCRLTIP